MDSLGLTGRNEGPTWLLVLLDLIDVYAAERAARDTSATCAVWALVEADDAMHTARAAVRDALGITTAPPLADDVTALAQNARAREAAWRSHVDAITGAAQ